MPSIPIRKAGTLLTLDRIIGITVIAFVAWIAAAATPGSAGISWRGDYESGNFSQWDCGVQQKSGDRATIVTSPVRQGRYAARFEVRPGDTNVAGSGSNGERTEALSCRSFGEGQEQWWAWSTMFAPDFSANDSGWNLFTQWHNSGTTGGTVAFFVAGNKIAFQSYGGDPSHATARSWQIANKTNGSWYDFVFHVKWSSNPNVGFVEVWVNGSRVVPLTYTATLYNGQTVYLKQGYYRAAQPNTAVIYEDGMRQGTSYNDVSAEFPGTSDASSSTPSSTQSPAATQTPVAATPQTVAPSTPQTVAPSTPQPVAPSPDKASPSATTVGATAPSVTQNIANGRTLRGAVPWIVTQSGAAANKVEFRIDGSLRWTETSAPWVFDGDGHTLDTTAFANGHHVLTATAYALNGASASTTASVTFANPATAGSTTTQAAQRSTSTPSLVRASAAIAPLAETSYAVEWDGRLFPTMGAFRLYIAGQGVNWQTFLLRHPALVRASAIPSVNWDGRLFYDQRSLDRYLRTRKTSYAGWAKHHPAAAAILAGTPVAGITRQPAQVIQKRPRISWAGIDFTSAGGFKSYLTRQGTDWNQFLVQHPAAAARLSLTALTWHGTTFYSRSALSDWLEEHRDTLGHWMRIHPGLAEQLTS